MLPKDMPAAAAAMMMKSRIFKAGECSSQPESCRARQ
jgi:hypothetical protein